MADFHLDTSEAEARARDPGILAELVRELREIRADMLSLEERGMQSCAAIHPSYDVSARNLLHYMALRKRDLRALQSQLMRLGLSSLGRCEAHSLATIDAVLGVLYRLEGLGAPPATPRSRVGIGEGERLLERHSESLLGPPRNERRVRIMVTMPDEAAEDPSRVRRWIEQGMDVARINCAHGDAASWEQTIAHLRRAALQTGRSCRIFMDLAGPKLRTGPVEPGPEVLKLKPQRDALGRVLHPATAWLTGVAAPALAPAGCATVVPVEDAWLATLNPGDVLELRDGRGAMRRLSVRERTPGGARIEGESTCYLVPGTLLVRTGGPVPATGRVGALPAHEGVIRLAPGDPLVLTRSLEPGRAALLDAHGRTLAAARIGCTLPGIFAHVRPGERVWFDDGRIGCRVRASSGDELELEVVSARPEGSKLRADKGINLPDTELALPALTPKDLEDLPFVAEYADAVALSFVHAPSDVLEIEERLKTLGHAELGIVLKIETRRAFDCLPQLLLASMQSPCDGVMIARGDLAVECGFERMAEVQEEILWVCEAAHVPVIWATQVLETLAREGRPSRAEITDAAMSERAECVMLNKGPHIDQALTALDDILRRMQGHQRKKSAVMRPLGLAQRSQL